MNPATLSLLLQTLLEAAIEVSTINRAMAAEGRTEPTEEEKARIRAATDASEQAARLEVAKL